MSRPEIGAPEVRDVEGAPTEDEVAAIVAAVEALWPRPVPTAPPSRPPSRAWKLSGRWWSRPLPVRRDRPWR